MLAVVIAWNSVKCLYGSATPFLISTSAGHRSLFLLESCGHELKSLISLFPVKDKITLATEINLIYVIGSWTGLRLQMVLRLWKASCDIESN